MITSQAQSDQGGEGLVESVEPGSGICLGCVALNNIKGGADWEPPRQAIGNAGQAYAWQYLRWKFAAKPLCRHSCAVGAGLQGESRFAGR